MVCLTHVSQTISLATSPNAITYNSSDDSIYVTNMGSDTVSAISNISRQAANKNHK